METSNDSNNKLYTLKKYRRAFRNEQLKRVYANGDLWFTVGILGIAPLFITALLTKASLWSMLLVPIFIILVMSAFLIYALNNYNIEFPTYNEWVDDQVLKNEKKQFVNNINKEKVNKIKSELKNPALSKKEASKDASHHF